MNAFESKRVLLVIVFTVFTGLLRKYLYFKVKSYLFLVKTICTCKQSSRPVCVYQSAVQWHKTFVVPPTFPVFPGLT